MASKALGVGALIAVLAVGGYWYWSPYLAIDEMKSAAKNKDADGFNQFVDYPRLRESLKRQFSASIAERLGEVGESNNEIERAGAALGTRIGLALADRLIDGMVQPEIVMRAMEGGNIGTSPTSVGAPPAESELSQQKPEFEYSRKGINQLIAYAAGDVNKTAGLVFERTGFATWRLTEIQLPSSRE